MRGDSKISPRFIIRAHHRTYVSARTGMRRVRDYLLLDGVPALILIACLFTGVTLTNTPLMALLTVTGLLGALLFGVMLQVSNRAMDWADGDPEPSKETSQHAIYLEELAANAGYASLVCIAAAVAFTAGLVSYSSLGRIVASSVGLALGVHLVLVLLMVMKRVFALTQERLNHARTGSGRRRLSVPPDRKRAS